ncbi:MAG: alpha/beta hydrolase [Actinomycetota bacterium]
MTAPVEVLTSTDGQPVAVHDFGGDGPPLVFGHGNGMNAGMWAAVIHRLRASFHCYGIDLRGHGAARAVAAGYSVARTQFADDVLTVIEHVGGPVAYAGHSLGGGAGVYAALVRPELFTGMWLFEPIVVPDGFRRPGNEPGPLIEIARRRRMTFDSVDDAINRFSAKPPFSGCDPVSVRAYVEIGTYPIDEGVRLACEGENEARVFEQGDTIDFDRLAEVEIPIVVASGAADDALNALPAHWAPMIAKALGNGAWVEMPGLTHFGPMENPDAIAGAIGTHLA